MAEMHITVNRLLPVPTPGALLTYEGKIVGEVTGFRDGCVVLRVDDEEVKKKFLVPPGFMVDPPGGSVV